jgi:hypothetical protein
LKIQLIDKFNVNICRLSTLMSFTPICGHTADKSYHKNNKQYYCRACTLLGGFTPYKLEYFAPFSSMEEATQIQQEMRTQLFYMLDQTKNSPKHQIWVRNMRAAGYLK